MKSAIADPRSRLWAVTCHFNPCGYQRRIANYRVFRRGLQVPLVTVELSFTGTFELRSGDADLLIQVHAGDVMWQKERLLNVAISALPAHCDRVAWLDADVVFADDEWPVEANAALDRHAMIQPFGASFEVTRDASPDVIDAAHSYMACRSLARGLAEGHLPADFMLRPDKRTLGITVGLAWASHRFLLERCGLYDAHILFGAPSAIVAAARGRFDDSIDYMYLNAQRRQHYLEWAGPFYEAIRGDIGWSKGTIFHLWHGDLAHRGYNGLRTRFAQFDFDPCTDIAITPEGPWRWNSEKPLLHRFVRDYFAERLEDGEPENTFAVRAVLGP